MIRFLLTVRVYNEVSLDDSATTNNTVIVNDKNSASKRVTVKVNGIMKSAPKVSVHYMYRGVDISGIVTEIENLDTGKTVSATSGDNGAVFTYVPAGEYQLTIKGKDSNDKVVVYETDMYVYEIEQAQNTVFTVDNKEVNVVINLARTEK